MSFKNNRRHRCHKKTNRRQLEKSFPLIPCKKKMKPSYKYPKRPTRNTGWDVGFILDAGKDAPYSFLQCKADPIVHVAANTEEDDAESTNGKSHTRVDMATERGQRMLVGTNEHCLYDQQIVVK